MYMNIFARKSTVTQKENGFGVFLEATDDDSSKN